VLSFAIESKTGHPVVLLLCGCKVDLRLQYYDEWAAASSSSSSLSSEKVRERVDRCVSFENGLALAQKIGARGYYEIANTTGQGLPALFNSAASYVLDDRYHPVKQQDKKCIVM
jgi:hypothetical protein